MPELCRYQPCPELCRYRTHDTLTDDSEKSTDNKGISLLAASGAIREALNNDLNTPEAMRVIDEAFAKLDGKSVSNIHQHGLEQLIESIDDLLGLQLEMSTPDIDDATKQLIIERERARDNKDWSESDRLRDQLAENNIVVQDTKDGSIWEYKN